MPSIKCPQCGLVNFSTALQCKRCGNQFSELSPIAEQRPYQTQMPEVSVSPNQSFQPPQSQSFQSYQLPPPPPTFHNGQAEQSFNQPAMPLCCVKCAGRRGVEMQNFKKDYVPPVAYLGMLLGLLPTVILILILRVKHQLSAPFCGECWSKFRKVSIIENSTGIGFFVLLIIGGILTFSFNSGFPFFVCFAFSVGLLMWGQIYRKNHSPKFKKIDRKQVIIEDPTYGEVCFQR